MQPCGHKFSHQHFRDTSFCIVITFSRVCHLVSMSSGLSHGERRSEKKKTITNTRHTGDEVVTLLKNFPKHFQRFLLQSKTHIL